MLLIRSKGLAQDCNFNGVVDSVDIANCSGGNPDCDDCNNNGVPDECDLQPRLTYASPQTISTTVTRPVCLVAVDVNGVGGPDLVSGALDGTTLEIRTNNGSGVFSLTSTVAVGAGPFEIVAADFDGTNGVDLACVNTLDAVKSVTIALNNGSGVFSSPTSIAVDSGLTSIAVGDFDGTNGPDLAVLDRSDEEVTILLNNGSGVFTIHSPPQSLFTGDVPQRIVAFDYNDNNRLDLAVTNSGDDSLSIFRNEFPGTGGFLSATSLSVSVDGPHAILTDNFDADDGADLAITGDDTDDVLALIDVNETTAFISTGPFVAGSAPRAVSTADLNSDGHLDLATANFNANRVSVLLGDGNGGFFNPFASDLVTGSGPLYVVAADLNADNLPDLATVNRDSKTISVLFASLQPPVSVDCQPSSVPDECEPDCVTDPVALCRNVVRSAQGSCQVVVSAADVNNGSFDPDGGLLDLSLTPAGPFGLGTHSVTLTVFDQCCNFDSCVAQVTIVDEQSPFITCPPDRFVSANSGCQYTGGIGEATATDNCTPSGSIFVFNDAPGSFSLGVTTVTWFAVDGSGNGTSCTQQVEVVDDQSPVINCPPDRTLGTNLGCSYLGGFGAPTATDNCSSSGNISITSNAPLPLPLGTTVVTWTARDEAGNSAVCTQSITIIDNDDPVINCPGDITVQTNSGCNYFGGFGNATANDNCSTASNLDISNDAPSVLPLGVTMVTWTATDESGNQDSCTQRVTVVDGGAPFISCPISITPASNVGCSYVGTIGTANVSDSCSSPEDIDIANDAPLTFSMGLTVVTWTATDEAGNSSECTQNVTVVDSDPPTINCPADRLFEINSGCEYVGTFGTATASDSCSNVANVVVENDAPSTFPLGETDVTWTATDEAGNSVSCIQRVRVIDKTPPSVSCPAAFELPANTGCLYVGTIGDATATDTCSLAENIVVDNDAPSSLPLGETLVTWTATDEAGNSASCTQVVTVTDQTLPDVTCPEDLVVSSDVDCSYVDEIGEPTASDNCTAPEDLVVLNDAPTVYELGVTLVVWSVTDEAGNTRSCTQRVTVVDDTPPVVTCPAEATFGAGSECGYTGPFGTAVAVDNCSAVDAISVSHDAPTTFLVGTTVVTWTATDEVGNSSTCTQDVTVLDTQPPVITCPGDISFSADANCGFSGSIGEVVVSDNCTRSEAVVVTNDAPATFGLGVTVVTWTALDEAGNSAICTQTVTVLDDEPPSLSCPGPAEFSANGSCGYIGGFGVAGATDNCSAVGDIVVESNAPVEFPLGTTVVTWTATDQAGNTATCLQDVTVIDVEPPTLSCPGALELPANQGCAYAGSLGEALVTDNCAEFGSVTVTNDAPAQLPLGRTVVTWTATDAAGNQTRCTQEVDVVDDTAPLISCPAAVSLEADQGCSFGAELVSPSVGDNCSSAEELVLSNDAPESLPLGLTLVTWSATDLAGNLNTCTQEILVADKEPPQVSCVSEVVIGTNSGCEFVGELPPLEVVDNCTAAAEIQISNNAPAALPIGSTRVTWLFTDAAGNIAACQTTVVVEDRTPPVLTCPLDLTVPCTSGGGTVVDFEVEVEDICTPEPTLTYSQDPGSVFPLGSTVVTCTATDSDGNEANCEFTVEVTCGVGRQVPGDCNQDGSFDISDPVCLLGFLFLGRPTSLPCGDGGLSHPANVALYGWGRSDIDLTSAILALQFLFLEGEPHPLGSGCLERLDCPSACAVSQ